MDRPSRLVLVRHAASARNEAKKGSVYFADDEARERVRGVPDHLVEITQAGHRQALATGPALRERYGVFDYAYHSGYTRTIQTLNDLLAAYPVAERQRIQVRSSVFLRERDPGYTYDMTQAEAEAAFPWLREHWETFGGFFARPPGGLSLADVVSQVYLFYNMLVRDRAGKNVLVVLHGGTLRCFRFILERWTYEQALRWPRGQSPKNCGVTNYEYDERAGRLVLESYNQVYY